MSYPIPSNARQIAYLESTGTQWIDTGVLVDPTVHSFLLDCSFEGAFQNANSTIFIDARDTNENDPIKTFTLNFGGNANQNKTVLCWFENQGGQRNHFAQNFVLERGTLSYSNGVVTRNGISISVPTSSGLREQTLLLCARRYSDNSTITAFGAYHLRVYGFTISDGSTLVRSFIPCRILDTGYLWDEVEGKFYGNSGTGDFVLGPDVQEGVVPSRLNPFGVGRRMEKIRRVEYLENASGGGQVINTDTPLTSDTTFEVVYQPLEFPSDKNKAYVVCGSRSEVANVQRVIVFHLTENYTCLQKGGFTTDWKTTYTTGFVTAKIGPTTGRINGDTFTLPSVQSANTPIYLFGQYADGLDPNLFAARYRMRVKAFRIWQSDTLVRDFVPVAIGSIGYLLDRVSGRLFGNSGTGNFVLGPDIVPVEWVSAPLGAYVDSGVMLTPTMSIVLEAISGGNTPRQQRLFGYSDSTLGNTVLYVNGSGYMAATIAGTGGYNNFEPFSGRRVNASMSMGDGAASIRITYPNGTVRDWSSTLGVLGGAYSATLPIFAFSRETGVDVGVECLFRLVSLSVFDGSTLVRDFVPVRVGTEGALYDRVTDTVFRSATSTPLLTPS